MLIVSIGVYQDFKILGMSFYLPSCFFLESVSKIEEILVLLGLLVAWKLVNGKWEGMTWADNPVVLLESEERKKERGLYDENR